MVLALSLLQWIFPTQESNQGLLHCRQILYQPSYQGSHSCSNPSIGCSSSSKHLCTLCTCAGTLSTLACRAVRKIHPNVSALLPCLSKENSPPVMPFQCYPVTCPPPPSFPPGPMPRGPRPPGTMWWPLASSFHWSLRLPYMLGTLPTLPIVPMITEPRLGKARARKQIRRT